MYAQSLKLLNRPLLINRCTISTILYNQPSRMITKTINKLQQVHSNVSQNQPKVKTAIVMLNMGGMLYYYSIYVLLYDQY